MKEVYTTIEIAAPKARVWSVLTDFVAYPDWNPFLRSVATALRPGAAVALTVAIGRRALDLDATIVRVTPERELRWAGPIARWKGVVFRGEHYFVIEETAADRVRFVHGERFAGFAVPLMGRWIDRTLAPAYESMNVALRRRAEAAAAP